MMFKKKEKNFKIIFIGVLVEIGFVLGFIVVGVIVILIFYFIVYK